jgi:TRAP-type mannitol/chloroaromatic compound transport system permease small subunit
MSILLKLAQAVDWFAERLSRIAAWAVLLAAVISAGNAFLRYGLDLSSNAWLEIQWYLFGTIVMLGAPLVLKLNEHVRVDIIYGRLPGKGPVWVDLLGLAFFLLPVMGLLTWLTWPFFWNMYVTKEMSGNISLVTYMFLQGLAEIVKRIAYLRGVYEMDTHYEKPVQ